MRTVVLVATPMLISFFVLTTFTLPVSLTFTELQNFGHFLIFIVLGFFVLWHALRLLKPRSALALAISTLGLLTLGISIELFQTSLAGRTASLHDLLLDAAGIVVGYLTLGVVLLWRNGVRSASLAAAAVILAVVLVLARPVIVLAGFDFFRPPLPTIRDFSHVFSSAKIAPTGSASFALTTSEADQSRVLRVKFGSDRYPGVIFHESGGQWSDYTTISVKIFSALQNTRQIQLRIDDTLHNNRYQDRYNGSFSISPGLNEVIVPLADVVRMGQANPDRQLNIDDVSRILLFATDVTEPFELDIIRLELF